LHGNIEAERGLLGSILLDAQRVLGICSDRGIDEHSFTEAHYRHIFVAANTLFAEGNRCIDSISVSTKLKQMGQLKEIGGALFLDELIDATPTSTHAVHYAELVIAPAMNRQILNVANLVKEMAENDETGEAWQETLAYNTSALSEIASDSHVETAEQTWESVEAQHEEARKGNMPGLAFPWDWFTDMVGGWPLGLVSLVAGVKGTRKSFLLNQCATFLSVDKGIPGCYMPYEDGNIITMRRSACMRAKVSTWRYMRGAVNADEHERVAAAARQLIASPLHYLGKRGMTAKQINLAVARGVAKHGWRFVVLDGAKDIKKLRGMGRNESDDATSQILCDCADKHNIAMIVVHHIRKDNVEGQRKDLTLDDVKGSGGITDDARMVCILERKKNKLSTKEKKLWDYSLHAAKTNHGPSARIHLTVNEDTGTFKSEQQ
jgi:replicative DNA helicase